MRKSSFPSIAPATADLVQPIASGAFTGKVIILTNGMTAFAASDVAAILSRAQRASVVGSPPSSAVNRMYAEKFARVLLPSSGLVLNIPLVKIVTEADGERAPRPRPPRRLPSARNPGFPCRPERPRPG